MAYVASTMSFLLFHPPNIPRIHLFQVLNGGLSAVPPQAHSGGHPSHTSHPIYTAHAPHHLMSSAPSPLAAASLPTSLSAASVPPCGSPAQPPVVAYASAGNSISSAAAGNQPASYSTPPQLCPLQLSVSSSYAPPTGAQPPAAHSANAYIPPYSSPSQPGAATHPYSTHAPSPTVLQTAPSSQPPSTYPPAHVPGAPHIPNSHHPSGGSVVHGIPNSHHSHQHHPHLQPHPQQQLAPPSSSASAVHHLGAGGGHSQPSPIGGAPAAGAQIPHSSASHPQISSGYNHLAPIPPTYAALAASAHGRSSTASSVTSDASTVVVAAPSSYAISPHTSNSFSSLYAPYSNTPYLPSHSVSTYACIVRLKVSYCRRQFGKSVDIDNDWTLKLIKGYYLS